MYCGKCKYTDFSLYSFLEELYENSCQEYFHTVEKESHGTEIKRDLILIQQYINFLEDYIMGLEELNYIEDRQIIMEKLKYIHSIAILPKDRRYLNIEIGNNKIKLNPNCGEFGIRLTLYSKLNEYAHFAWSKKMRLKINKQQPSKELYICRGYNLIDKATSIDTAEEIAHHTKEKKRPSLAEVSDEIFDGKPYYTNFFTRGEIQQIATNFGIINNLSLRELSSISFRDDFIKIIESPYDTAPLKENLKEMLVCMGKIDQASDEKAGICKGNTIDTSSVVLDELSSKFKEAKSLVLMRK